MSFNSYTALFGAQTKSSITIYHGSNLEVREPKVLVNRYQKDFGFAFYCTEIQKQAERWASTCKGESVVNIYEYIADPNLNTLKFDSMSEEWLDFIVNCRRGISHSYDIVEGPMADDTIWNYIEDFLVGEISRPAFWELVKFKYPTHQIAFLTDSSLKTIKWKGAYKL